MKRIGFLYDKVISMDNLILADKKARKGKSRNKEIIRFDKNKEQNILDLHEILKNKSYVPSKYSVFTIYETKERVISKAPYYPDRLIHHAILNSIENILYRSLTRTTYSCIKYRGIHKALQDLKIGVSDDNIQYALKFDIKKFYPSVDNVILKELLRKKFKDKELLWLLGSIIDSNKGLPLGNYCSQWFANYYLSRFDHWLKQELNIKYVYRYCDDIIVLSSNKQELHTILQRCRNYLWYNLNLEVKSNYQIFKISTRGIDFVGYKVFKTHVLLRNRIKKRFKRMLLRYRNKKSTNSYLGWTKHGNCRNLERKLLQRK